MHNQHKIGHTLKKLLVIEETLSVCRYHILLSENVSEAVYKPEAVNSTAQGRV